MEFDLDLADVKPSVMTAVLIFIMVALTVPLAKAILTRWYVPGVTELVLSI